ncbi:uncharacterized protein LOC132699827 [Cylas formicarius]|uniref:uncharacterized protein LOC132699827 n=1 Tax=Cylas formicarius TaxID=197179 RepID=UPI0029587404|nr:uncharacterized protein LOC132699827 [Cylas formicarius]
MSADGPDPVGSPREKRKLPGSHSEESFDGQKTIRQKLIAKVKSWSGKDTKFVSQEAWEQSGTSEDDSPKLRKSPKSLPALSGTSKLLFWDPYDRKGRGNRKAARKKGKSTSVPRNDPGPSLDDAEEAAGEDAVEPEKDNLSKYAYDPRSTKSVVFTDEVLVVYFKNELVVGEATEPLKKEAEQQTRNKEMRRCHLVKYQDKYNLCLF